MTAKSEVNWSQLPSNELLRIQYAISDSSSKPEGTLVPLLFLRNVMVSLPSDMKSAIADTLSQADKAPESLIIDCVIPETSSFISPLEVKNRGRSVA